MIIETSTLMTMMGITITVIGVVATLITIVIGGYALLLQKALSKKSEQEFKEHFDKMLDNASKDPAVLEKFIQCVIEKDEFKNRFLALIKNEIENVLDSRLNINIIDALKNDDNEDIKSQFQQKGQV